MAVQRVLRNTQANLEVTFYSGGAPTDADGAVTVDITRGDGSSFVAGAATTHGATGHYSYTLAPQATLDYFTLVWTGTFGGVVQKITTHTEIVGAFYAPLNDIRAMAGLGSATNFPNATLEEARQWFEDMAETYCQRAFVPRYALDRLDGDGTNAIRLLNIEPRTILSCKVNGVTQTDIATWALYPTGLVVRPTLVFDVPTSTSGFRNVVITYEYGADEPDLELREAALRAIQYRALGDQLGLPAEAMSAAVDVRGPINFGPFQAQNFGMARPTGIPEVDLVLTSRSMAVGVG